MVVISMISKINFIFVWIFICISCVSCMNNKNCYKYEIKEVDLDSVPCDVIYGERLPFDLENAVFIYLTDTLLIVHRDYDQYCYNVYNFSTLDSIMSFGLYGRSRNEFLSRPINLSKQLYNSEGGTIFPIIDNGICKEVNITSTVSRGYTVIDDQFESIPSESGYVVYYGSNHRNQFAYIKGHGDDFYKGEYVLPNIIYADERGKIRSEDVFSKYMENNNPTQLVNYFYDGNLMMQPDGFMVAQPLNYMSYILYYDVKKHDYFAIHIKGTRTFEEGTPDCNIEQTPRSFSDDAVLLSDKLIVLYYGDYSDMITRDPDYGGRLLVFDWNGNLSRTYILHSIINKLAYNQSTGILLGLNSYSGELYKYHLEE